MPVEAPLRLILFIVYKGAQLLDITGPASVFTEAAAFLAEPPYRVILASSSGGVVTTESGIALATTSFTELEAQAIDTLVMPGADEGGLRGLLRDSVARDWWRSAAPRAERIASVCTGAFALASWGFLDGRRATTHWAAAADLARRFPNVEVDGRALFIEDGPVWTSAGVSTGMDMALALIESDLGRPIASGVARRLVLQMRRPGHQSQFSPLLSAQSGEYAELAAWISDNLAADLSLDVLAEHIGQAPRTLHRRFLADTGSTPAAFVERLRLDRARSLLEAGQAPKRVAAVAGFGSLDRLGRAFRRAYALTPSAYQALHAA